ncbi:MAG TPA: ribonuclease PH [bacterium]|nr:ribonuclease PH [bacterium]
MSSPRSYGRGNLEARPVKITPDAVPHAEGSALVEFGDTRVLCAATVEENIPKWLQGKGGGWVTGEYDMLPRSTHTRTQRSRGAHGVKGRTHEIQRLIGRALRAGIDLTAIGPRTITVDCDVISADGGTRTAAVTGGFVAMALAARWIHRRGLVKEPIATLQVAAISVGVIAGEVKVDLDYSEDSNADVDSNLVMTANKEFIEVQGTGERTGFERKTLDAMIDAALPALDQLFVLQRRSIGESKKFD